jgi:hypothetical protein
MLPTKIEDNCVVCNIWGEFLAERRFVLVSKSRDAFELTGSLTKIWRTLVISDHAQKQNSLQHKGFASCWSILLNEDVEVTEQLSNSLLEDLIKLIQLKC